MAFAQYLISKRVPLVFIKSDDSRSYSSWSINGYGPLDDKGNVTLGDISTHTHRHGNHDNYLKDLACHLQTFNPHVPRAFIIDPMRYLLPLGIQTSDTAARALRSFSIQIYETVAEKFPVSLFFSFHSTPHSIPEWDFPSEMKECKLFLDRYPYTTPLNMSFQHHTLETAFSGPQRTSTERRRLLDARIVCAPTIRSYEFLVTAGFKPIALEDHIGPKSKLDFSSIWDGSNPSVSFVSSASSAILLHLSHDIDPYTNTQTTYRTPLLSTFKNTASEANRLMPPKLAGIELKYALMRTVPLLLGSSFKPNSLGLCGVSATIERAIELDKRPSPNYPTTPNIPNTRLEIQDGYYGAVLTIVEEQKDKNTKKNTLYLMPDQCPAADLCLILHSKKTLQKLIFTLFHSKLAPNPST